MEINQTKEKNIYIVLTQSGSIISRFLKIFTKDDYNHVSICTSSDLNKMYSFGRKYSYYPFWSGFIAESTEWGSFKRFSETQAIVLSLPVTRSQYTKIKSEIKQMLKRKNIYRYNYLGLVLASIKIQKKAKNRYYCSEFVKELLLISGIDGAENLPKITKPIHFLEFPNTSEIYKGRLRDFTHSKKTVHI